jgi:hypothetical protein
MEPDISASRVRKVIENAQDENPVRDERFTDVRELPLAPLPRAGFRLAKFILFIISGYILFLVIVFIFSSFDAAQNIGAITTKGADTMSAQKLELIKVMQQEKQHYRDYMMQMSQMILLNLLLPTLTAILGYIFGSREENRRSVD